MAVKRLKVMTFIRNPIHLLALVLTSSAYAHPVTYQGALSVMSWNSPMMSDQWIGYSVTPQFAVNIRYFALRDGDRKQEFYFPQVNYLLKRWNEPDSQANIYLSAGYGVESSRNQTTGTLLSAVEADWESRKYYVSGKFQRINSFTRDEITDYVRFRMGVAPYLADFEGLHTWLIVQFERQPEYFRSIQVTPILRFFYQNVLWEAGYSVQGNAVFNFMVHF